jgi:hypothetical protein
VTATLANAGSVDRNSTDFYPTPGNVTTALLDCLNLDPAHSIWEPAAGEGHMVKVLAARGHKVVATDLYSYTYENFLDVAELRADWIITNPPFKLAEEFIRHAIGLRPQGVAMLLKSQYWHAASRLKLFQEHRPSFVFPLTWRPDFLFGKKGAAPTMEVLWTVWFPPLASFATDTLYAPLAKPKENK